MADVLERLKEFGYNAEPAQDPKQQESERVATLDRLVRMGYGVKPLPKMPTEEELYQQQLQSELSQRSAGMMDYLPGPVKDVASAAAGYASDMAGVGLRGSAAAENLVRGLIPDKLEGAAGFALKTALPGVGHAVTAMGSEEMSRKKLDLANDLQKTSEAFDQAVDKARGDGVIGWARKMGTGALRSGANMLTGAALGGPAGAIALGGATEASQTYGELEQAGASEASQVGWAAAAGVWESTVGGIMQKLGLGGAEKLLKEAGGGAIKQLWKMPLKEAVKEVAKAQGQEIVEEEITELGHLGMRYANGMQQYVSPEETIKDIFRTVRDTAAQTAIMTGGVQAGTQLGLRGQTPPTQPPPAAPVPPQTPPPAPTSRPPQRGGLNPPTTPRPIPREELEAIRAKGPVSRKDGKELGLTPEQLDNQATRTKAVDDLLEKAKEEAVPVEAPAPVVEDTPTPTKPVEAPVVEAAPESPVEATHVKKKSLSYEAQKAYDWLRNTDDRRPETAKTPEEVATWIEKGFPAIGKNAKTYWADYTKETGRTLAEAIADIRAESAAKRAPTHSNPVEATPEPTIQSTDQTDIERAVAEAMAQEDAAEEAAKVEAVPAKKARSARKPSKEAEALAERAANGESVERPADVSEARWKAMVAQKAKRIGKAAPKTEPDTIQSPMKVGENIRIMGVESTLARSESVDGVRYDLFNGAALKEDRAAVRQYDEDSGNVIGIKQFPTYDAAEKYLDSEVKKAAPTPKSKGTPKKPAPKNVSEVVKAVAAQGEQEKRGTVSEAKSETARIADKLVAWKGTERLTDPENFAGSWARYDESQQKAVVDELVARGELPISFSRIRTGKKSRGYVTSQELLDGMTRKYATDKFKKPARKPSAETKQAQAEKDQAGKDLLREARKLKSFLPGAVDPELAKAAVKYLKAAVKLEYFRFKDFVKYVISQSSKERALELDQYLQAAWKQQGAKDPRLDKPISVQALLKKPVKKATKPKAEKAAPQSNWQDSVLSALAGKTKVDQAVTLPELWAQIEKANPGLTMEEFKQGLLKLHTDGKILLEDFTGKWAEIPDRSMAIEGPGYDEKRGYGLKWWVRGVEGDSTRSASSWTGTAPVRDNIWRKNTHRYLRYGEEAAGLSDVKMIPIESVESEEHDHAPDSMIVAIKNGGSSIPPIIADRMDDGTYIVADGSSRLAAARKLGLTHVPVREVLYSQPVESPVKNPVPPPVKEVPKETPPPSDVGEKVVKGGDTTGTKNAKTDEMRAKLGLPERPPVQPQTFEEWEAEGARRLAANPDYARDLAEDLVANPRAVDPGDNAALGQYTTQLQNRHDAGEDVKSEMAMVIQAAELVGTEASHALASRKAERYPDLSLATFVRKHVQDLGSQPSKEQLEKYAALADEIAALKAENQKLREADAKAEIEKRILEAKLAAKPKAAPKEKIGTKKERLQRQASEAVASFKSAWNDAVKAAGGAFTASGIPLNPEAIAASGRAAKAAAAVVKAYAELGVNSFVEFISRVKADIGPLDADQEKLFRDEWDKAVAVGEITRPVNSASTKPAVGVMAKQLTRWAVESGITETEAVIDTVHAELLSMGVNQTRSDTMDAMSGYGDFQELPHDPVSDIVRGIKGEIRAQRQLEDYEQGRAALRSGVERPEPTEAERQLRKDVNEAKKRDGIVSRDPAKELKSALDTAKTAVENAMVDTELAIEALKKAIADKTPLTKADPAPGPVDDALKAMREKLAEKRLKRKELRAEYDKLFPAKRGALTDAKRLAMAEALLKRLNEEVVDEIKSLRDGTWEPTNRVGAPTSAVLTRLQATNDALKAALNAAREGSPAYQAELQAKEDAQYIKAQEKRLAFWEKVETEARLGILPKTKPKKVRSNPQILTNDIAIKKKKNAALYEMEMEKRRQWNLGQWIFAGINDAASLLPRALMLGLEASPLTRQGRMYLGSPSKVLPNLVRSIASVFSERMAFSQNENLRNRANFKSGEYEAAGVDFTDSGGATSKMEEIYQSAILRWLSKTEGVFWIPLRWPAKAYMASERGVQNFLNGMRADIYDTGKLRTQRIRQFFDKHGIPTETEWSKNDIKNWGRAANIFSGRGTGIRGNAATNFFFLAARWTVSTLQTEFQVPFQMATPKFIGQWNADAATRIAHAQLYAQAVLAGVTHLAAVYWLMMLLADDDDETDDKPTVETDWTSTDLWKVRVGDTTIDTLGGLQQPFVFVNRIIRGTKKKRSGEIVPLRGEGSSPYKGDAWIEFTNQLLYKSGPAFSGIIDFWRQKTVMGEQLPDNPAKRVAVIAGKRMVPITYQDMIQVEKNLGWKQGTLAALEAFIGSSIGTYGDRTDYLEGTPEEREKQFDKDLEEMTWNSPGLPYADLLTEDQTEQVAKRLDVVRGELIMDAMADPPEPGKAKDVATLGKAVESLQKRQEAFQKDQASFAALKAQVSLEEAERLLAVRYAENMKNPQLTAPGTMEDTDGDGKEDRVITDEWIPSRSKKANADFKIRRDRLRAAWGK